MGAILESTVLKGVMLSFVRMLLSVITIFYNNII